MKILYIAHERSAAQVADTALRRLVPNARMSWARDTGVALGWLRDNGDTAAVFADCGTEDPEFEAFLADVRSLGMTTPIAAVAPEHLQALSAAFKANLDGLVFEERAKGEVLAAQLAEICEWRREAEQRREEQDTALASSTRTCTSLQERLVDLETALHGAGERGATQTAAIEQLVRREAELSAAVAEAAAVRAAIEQRLTDSEAAGQQVEQRAVENLAAAGERYAILEDHLIRETARRTTLEERLAAAEHVREDDHREHAVELAALTGRLGEREAHHEAASARTSRICTALQQRLLELEAAIHTADERHAADAAAVERLALREQELGTAVADGLAVRTALEHRLSERDAAYQRVAVDLTVAAQRCSAFEDQAARETTARVVLEQRLDAAEGARLDADRQHATALASLTTRLADLQAQHDTTASRNAALEQQLHESAGVLEQARRDWRSEVATLTGQLQQRETTFAVFEADTIAARAALEHRLVEAGGLHQAAQQRLAVDLAEAADRYAALEGRLREEVNARTSVESRLTAAELAGHEAGRQHATALAALTARLEIVQAQHEAAMSQHVAAEQQLTETAAALEHAQREWRLEVAALSERQQQREAEFGALEAETLAARTALEHRLAEAETAARDAERQHASALASLAAQLADVETRHQAAMGQQAHDAGELTRQLTAMRTRAAALRRHAERVSVLERQLDESHKDNRRQFERAPYGLYECTREGVVTRVNHSLARMLGYRGTDLQRMNVAATIFESAADVQWLLERTRETRKVESVETTLKTLDRRRLFVRMHALTADGPVVIAVEDLTRLSALEQRLREAQRMEAVGRVASEVAVTCDTLLQDVSQGGRQWLAVFESDTPIRQQGEQLLGDVSRAAGFLRQLGIYGHQQLGNIEPVSVPRLLRDVAPVLKRVLGDDITLLLPKTTDRFEVDVDAERVERILVNVANYARERMPNGGRVSLQLATVVVDRKFLASHPRVRPGAHVLITITEVQGAVWPVLPIQLPIGRSAPSDAPRAKPGMDLGPLVALIGDSGGHLWMSAEPAGNVTLQIHLPQRAQDEIVDANTTASWSDRGRHLTRWFRH